MRAIEIISKTDNKELLSIDYQLTKSDSNMRLIFLMDDNSNKDDEKLQMDSISNNPALDFLKNESEDYIQYKMKSLSMINQPIVLVPFPFDDFSNSKVRPALC